tara:strand:+ start:7076 stop:7774 length:699 start_codon:yes stop_codon:yes gene_type:complete
VEANKIMKILIDSKEAHNTKASFQMLLNADVVNLPEGDIVIENDDGKRWTIERKTWGDAYSSWSSKRIQEQISRMVENCDKYILLIEGSWSEVYADMDSIKGLQTFFNRMSVEVCPVVYTDSLDETIRYVRSLSLRVKDGTVNTLVRPTTVVTSSRNKHHAMLEQIPRVGRATAKKIYENYENLQDFVENWEDAPERGVAKGATWNAVDTFIRTPWKGAESKVIVSKAEDKR